MDLSSLIVFAAEEHEKSKTLFYVVGSLLAAGAVAISVFGFTRPDFPENTRTARLVMVVGAILVVATMFSAVHVSG